MDDHGVQPVNADDKLFDYQLQLLKQEIEVLHKRISEYQDLSFKIKGWAVTLWAGIVALSVQQRAPAITFVAVLIPIAFLSIDGSFRMLRSRSVSRIVYIEEFVNGVNTEGTQIDDAFKNNSFGSFPVNDPTGRLSAAQNEIFSKKLAQATSLKNNWGYVPALFLYFMLALVALSIAALISI